MVDTKSMQSKRIHYFDVAKGILIIMVVYGHIGYCLIHKYSFDFVTLNSIHSVVNLWAAFFMAAFFVITGYCSSFNYTVKDFFVRNFKALIIPAFILPIFTNFISYGELHLGLKNLVCGNGLWFLYALFCSKMIYFILYKYLIKEKYVWGISLLFFFIGFVLTLLSIPEYWNYKHALLLLPCLSVGRMIKQEQLSLNKRLFILSLLVYGSFLFYYLYSGVRIPRITGGIVISWHGLVPYLLMSLTGSYIIIYISKIINRSSILESLGKHSLVIYCFHVSFIDFMSPVYGPLFKTLDISHSIFLYFSILISLTVICYFISVLLNLKYISILLGKF